MQQWYQCPNCGAPVAFGVRFCGNCGTQLNWPTQEQAQPPSQYQQRIQPPPVYQQLPSYQQQPITKRKLTSGRAKFGKAMVIIGITVLTLFVIFWLFYTFTYPDHNWIDYWIRLVNPVFLAALIGVILLARIVRRK